MTSGYPNLLAPTLPNQKRRSLGLVFCCTLIGAIAQLLIKSGAQQIGHEPSLWATARSLATNVPLMGGLCLYGMSAVLLVLALRHAELSMIYPVIALTFVWVTILSAVVFGESMTLYKIVGITTIVAGVALLGIGGHR
jgi:drug/metabolite transporter (DMT)-like permease